MQSRSAVRGAFDMGVRFQVPLQETDPLAVSGQSQQNGEDSIAALPQDVLHAASPEQRRRAYRVGVRLTANVAWPDPEMPNALKGAQGVLTSLSGNGAQVFLRQVPRSETLLLSIDPPDAFIEDRVRRQLYRPGVPTPYPALGGNGYPQICESVRASLRSVESRIVYARTHAKRSTDPIYALSLAFLHPHDGCYRLVRFLERFSLKGDGERLNQVPTAMAS